MFIVFFVSLRHCGWTWRVCERPRETRDDFHYIRLYERVPVACVCRSASVVGVSLYLTLSLIHPTKGGKQKRVQCCLLLSVSLLLVPRTEYCLSFSVLSRSIFYRTRVAGNWSRVRDAGTGRDYGFAPRGPSPSGRRTHSVPAKGAAKAAAHARPKHRGCGETAALSGSGR